MGYIGAQPATNFETVRKQVSTTNSGTTITLDFAVSSVQDILVTVNAVVQSYDNYSVSGTTLTLGGTLNNDRVEILYVGRTFQTVTPAVGTVTNEMLSGSIANSKLANSSITLNGSAVSLGSSASVDNTPNFHAYKSSNQSIAFQNNVKITFETESFDTDNAFSSSTFTVPSGKDGKYFLYASIQTNSSEDFDDYQIKIYKNGSLASGTRDRHFLSETIKTFTVLSLSATDYIEVYAYVGSGSNKTIVAESTAVYFGGFKII